MVEQKTGKTPAPAIRRTFESTGLSRREKFYPDLPRIAIKDVLDQEVEFIDTLLLTRFRDKETGEIKDLLLIHLKLDDKEYTTLTSAMVIMDRLSKVKEDNLFPIFGTIIKPDRYYDIV